MAKDKKKLLIKLLFGRITSKGMQGNWQAG
jgi:hypothetical protein